MKKDIFLIILAVGAQLFVLDKIGIIVNNYTVDSDEFVIHATATGKPIELLCNRDSPYCSPPKPGGYWMADWTVPVIEHRGDYVCRDVDLYGIAANPERDRKVGEYCLVEKGSR